MELFELLGKIAVSGVEETKEAIDSVSENAEKNAEKIRQAFEKIGSNRLTSFATDKGLDMDIEKQDFQYPWESLRDFFQNVFGSINAEIPGREIYNTNTVTNNNKEYYERTHENNFQTEKIYENNSYTEKIFEKAGEIEFKPEIGIQRLIQDLTEKSYDEDYEKMHEKGYSNSFENESFFEDNPNVSSYSISETDDLYNKFNTRWEQIGGTAEKGLKRMKQGIEKSIPEIVFVCSQLADKAENAIGCDGTASGVYLADSFRNGLLSGAVSIYNAASNVASTVSAIMSSVSVNDFSVKVQNEKASIPHYATGGIVTREHIAKVGENGAEAIIPLERNTEWIDRVAQRMSGNVGNDEVVSLLNEIKSLLKNQKIYLNGKALVGGIAGDIDRKLGSIARQKRRVEV